MDIIEELFESCNNYIVFKRPKKCSNLRVYPSFILDLEAEKC